MNEKTPYPFGYGVATDGPPVLTSSISSVIVGRRDNAGLQLLRLIIRRKGLKVSFGAKSGTGGIAPDVAG
jgi:hypothetical protein